MTWCCIQEGTMQELYPSTKRITREGLMPTLGVVYFCVGASDDLVLQYGDCV
jgi:hypothetical protein